MDPTHLIKHTPIADKLRKVDYSATQPVLIAGNIVGKSYTSPPKYDVKLSTGMVIVGVPEECLQPQPKTTPE